jgi:hypothetical protein
MYRFYAMVHCGAADRVDWSCGVVWAMARMVSGYKTTRAKATRRHNHVSLHVNRTAVKLVQVSSLHSAFAWTFEQ